MLHKLLHLFRTRKPTKKTPYGVFFGWWDLFSLSRKRIQASHKYSLSSRRDSRACAVKSAHIPPSKQQNKAFSSAKVLKYTKYSCALLLWKINYFDILILVVYKHFSLQTIHRIVAFNALVWRSTTKTERFRWHSISFCFFIWCEENNLS